MRLLLAMLLGLATAHAAPRAEASAVERARAYFAAGRERYQEGAYEAAIAAFNAGYQVAPRPEFLLNLGQAHRRLGHLEIAREMYQRYLERAPDDAGERGQVEDILRDLDAEIARAQAERRAAEARAQAEARAGETAPLVATPAAHTRAARTRKLWLVLGPVLGGVAVTALGVGLYFGLRGDRLGCGDPGVIGCVDAR